MSRIQIRDIEILKEHKIHVEECLVLSDVRQISEEMIDKIAERIIEKLKEAEK